MAGSPKKRARRLAAEAAYKALVAADPNYVAPPPAIPPDASSRLKYSLNTQTEDREALITWWRQQLEHMEAQYQARIELLRTAGEHPCPLFGRQVRELGALGIPKDIVGILIGISESKVEAYYAEDYQVGMAQLIIPVAANMARIAMSQNDRVAAKAAEAILNRRGGEEWRQPAQKLEIADDRSKGKGVIDSSKLPYEDRQALRLIIERNLQQSIKGVAAETIDGEQES